MKSESLGVQLLWCRMIPEDGNILGWGMTKDMITSAATYKQLYDKLDTINGKVRCVVSVCKGWQLSTYPRLGLTHTQCMFSRHTLTPHTCQWMKQTDVLLLPTDSAAFRALETLWQHAHKWLERHRTSWRQRRSEEQHWRGKMSSNCNHW